MGYAARVSTFPPTREGFLGFLREHGQTGSDDELVPPRQLFLVGGNPLPLRLAAAVLAPSWLCLIASPQSAGLLAALEESLRALLPDAHVLIRVLESAHHPRAMKELIAHLRTEKQVGDAALGLHYSGGTKTMGQNAVRALGHAAEVVCTYVDAEDDELRCDALDKGFPLSQVLVPFEDLFKLHQLTIKGSLRRPADLGRRESLARQIGDRCFAAPGSYRAYWDLLPPFVERSIDVPLDTKGLLPAGAAVPSGSVRVPVRVTEDKAYKDGGVFGPWSLLPALREHIPALPAGETWRAIGRDEVLKISDPKKVVQYLSTEWFEDWLLFNLSALKAADGSALFDDLLQGTELKPQHSAEFELDILGRCGHDNVLISCTTIDTKSGAKPKGLEALLRAQRLGGELTRVVLASFVGEKDLAPLWHELARLDPRAKNRVFVLGLPHYQGQSAVTHCDGAVAISETLPDLFLRIFSSPSPT